jgi:BirA family biotin operon repressor/biotin-[acetyl-CoA-carboxylase] ligase
LRSDRILGAMSRRARAWLKSLEVYPVIGSTNAELMSRAQQQEVDGIVCTAELQLAGRGRRGRGWFSPFGANLAVSMAMAIERPASGLGGVSLVVGLAVLDALEQQGVTGLSLKWPNDVLLGGAKLGGILIEMVHGGRIVLVIGVGLNVALPDPIRAALPQDVADLSGISPRPSRSALAGRIISAIVEFVEEFSRIGFAPFKPAFDSRHAYHGRQCRVLLGDSGVTGMVAGVTDEGELILQTAAGPRTFNAGEVSLREAT